MDKFWQLAGGRKMFLGIFATSCITVLCALGKVSGDQALAAISACCVGIAGAIAWEDRSKSVEK